MTNSTLNSLLTAPIASLDYGTRMAMIAAMLDGIIVKGASVDGVAVAVISIENVQPGEARVAGGTRIYTTCKLRRLAVLGSERNAVKAEKTFDRMPDGTERTIEIRTPVILCASPASWRVHQFYAGNRNCLYVSDDLPGTAFDELSLDGVIAQCGTDISLTVSHTMPETASFRAVLLGEIVKE